MADTQISDHVQAAFNATGDIDGALLPVLHEIQARCGYIPSDAVPLVADRLNLTRAEVHGVISYYHHFRQKPAGKVVVQVCRAEACQARGVDAVAAAVPEQDRVKIETIYCLGLCSVGPAAMVGDTVHARLDAEKLAALVAAPQLR
jgi:formate dehydrogenase subunit gamma